MFKKYNKDGSLRSRRFEKYGGEKEFVKKAKKWLREIPDGCLRSNKELWIIRNKNVNWSDSQILAIVERKFTSLDHAEWLNSVVKRIDRMCQVVESAELSSKYEEKFHKEFRSRKDSALDFMQSVKEYVHSELNVTEKQLDALNNTFKKFESLE